MELPSIAHEWHERYKRSIMEMAQVDEAFAECFMSQRKHTFNYNYPPELRARLEIICWPGVVSFFS